MPLPSRSVWMFSTTVAFAMAFSSISADGFAYSPEFASFVDDYYKAAFLWDPTQATYAGIHDYDDKLPDFSAKAFAERIDALHQMKAWLSHLRTAKQSPVEAMDAVILDH